MRPYGKAMRADGGLGRSRGGLRRSGRLTRLHQRLNLLEIVSQHVGLLFFKLTRHVKIDVFDHQLKRQIEV